jgi:hypothetical protein
MTLAQCILSGIGNVSDGSCRPNQNTRFVPNTFFPEIHAVYEIMYYLYVRDRRFVFANKYEIYNVV